MSKTSSFTCSSFYGVLRKGLALTCGLILLLTRGVSFAEVITGPNGMKLEFTVSGAYIGSYDDIVVGGLVGRNILGEHPNEGNITLQGTASIAEGGKPAWIKVKNTRGALLATLLGDPPFSYIHELPIYFSESLTSGVDFEFEIILEEYDYDLKPPQPTGNVIQVTATFKPSKPTPCKLECGVIDIKPTAGAIGQQITFSIDPHPIPGFEKCPTEQNTYWNFGDGKTSAGLDNTTTNHTYEYSDDFKVTVVYQKASYTESYECYKDGFIKIGNPGGGGGGGDPLVYPNLVPFKPSAWSDKIVVSKSTATSIDDNPLYTDDMLYVDWAVLNRSEVAIENKFYTSLYLDGNLKATWYTNSLLNNYYANVKDYSLGQLTSGTHTLEIRADVNETVSEGDETDNSFIKTFQVFPTQPNASLPNLRPYQGKGWASPLIVATKPNIFTDSATITDGDKVYIGWLMANDGGAKVDKTFYSTLYFDDKKIKSWYTKNLNVNKSAGAWNIPVKNVKSGLHEIKLAIDSTNLINESKEFDNEFIKYIYVDGVSYYAPDPDLTFVRPDTWEDSVLLSKKANGPYTDTFSDKDKIFVSWSIKNIGEGAVQRKFKVQIMVDDKVVKTINVKPLQSGEPLIRKNIRIGKISQKSSTISVLIDPDNFLSEDNKQNNQFSRSVNMTCPGCEL